ncbi:MAG: hypothetical protein Tsb009_15090 [Planctomycetaceae bacterium]
MVRSAQFVAAVLGLWLLLAAPAYLVARADGLEGLVYAAFLCLVPGLIVLAIASRAKDAGKQAMISILGGMVLRLLFVVAGIMVVKSYRPWWGMKEFVLWVLVFYLATVAIETKMVVASLRLSSSEAVDSNG